MIFCSNTPGTAGGPGGIYLLVKPKYWVTNYFAHGSFPEVGQKQRRRKKKERKRRERLNDGNNNGQATHGARMAHAWGTHGARMVHAWRTYGARMAMLWLIR